MRKQMKIAAVVSAAALLAIGASFTSMAAEKGTWKLEDGEWYCYDKDGEAYEDTFCLSNGKEFYVNEEGVLEGSRWVEIDNAVYYVNSAGEKVVNDWRLATPLEDEDADEEWYYFQSSGKRAENKKLVIDGKTYYFNGEGVMLTGWVDVADNNYAAVEETRDNIANIVYCDENGARVGKAWIKTYEPGVDVEEDDLDDYDEHWYYIGSKGKASTGKESNINKQTYFFNKKGEMLTGWVAEIGDDTYEEIGGEDETRTLSDFAAVYFCGDEDDGHVKKNKWIKEWKNTQYDAADADNSKKWFWIAKDGKVFIPETATAANAITFEDGEAATDAARFTRESGKTIATKTINDKTYAFNANGEMWSGLVEVDGKFFYYGESNDGVRKTGAQSIEDECGDTYKFYFGTEDKSGYEKAVGVCGAKSGKLYENGILVTSGDAKYAVKTVNGLDYIVNKSGSIQTSKKLYEEDDVEIFDASKETGIDFEPNAGVAKGSILYPTAE